ncbi:hypothetical protein GCM10023177_11890 [Streptomyces violaceoruber]|nr:hypothetical protein JCM4020_77140 [Streptomyces coelicolor]
MTLAALFQPGVVVGVDPGQDGDLLAAQSGHPAQAVARHVDVLRPQTGAARAQELPEVVVVHAAKARRCSGALPGCAAPRQRTSWILLADPRRLGCAEATPTEEGKVR